MNDITIRKASSLNDLRKVYRLVDEIYFQSGISERSANGMMIHHPGQDVVPQSHIFIAEMGDKMVGTMTLSLDNQFGLIVDYGFGEIIDRYRELYPCVASIWRFAILPQYQSDTRVLKRLFGLGALCLRWYNVSVSFVTLSPEHVGFYQRILCMEEVARGKDTNRQVKPEKADIVLMKLHTDKLPEKWFATPESELFAY